MPCGTEQGTLLKSRDHALLEATNGARNQTRGCFVQCQQSRPRERPTDGRERDTGGGETQPHEKAASSRRHPRWPAEARCQGRRRPVGLGCHMSVAQRTCDTDKPCFRGDQTLRGPMLKESPCVAVVTGCQGSPTTASGCFASSCGPSARQAGRCRTDQTLYLPHPWWGGGPRIS